MDINGVFTFDPDSSRLDSSDFGSKNPYVYPISFDKSLSLCLYLVRKGFPQTNPMTWGWGLWHIVTIKPGSKKPPFES